MDMNTGYWILEYGKVFCGYLFLMFLWPSVVFHGHLRGKSRTWRFGFCVTVPIVIMNTVVLLLGLFRVLNQWIICLLFYGVFVLAFVKNMAAFLDRKYKNMMEAKFPDVRTLKGKYRELVLVLLFFVVCFRYVKKAARYLSIDYIKQLKTYNWPKIRVKAKERIWNFGRRVSVLFWRYGIVLLVILYGMMYFTYGAFQVHSYGYGDLYTHHGWIYGLIQGKIFPEGVYPEAMHCFIYCLHAMFGLKVYNCMLFLAGIHITVLLVSVYCFFREAFEWKYTPFFVLIMFLMVDLMCIQEVYGMSRLQWTLPQEFGLYTPFLCALFLLRYLKSPRRYRLKKRIERYIWNEKLFLFMLSLAVSVAIHFYCTIMAFLLCVSFAAFFLKRILRIERLVPLAAAVLCGVLIAVTPMAAALASGIPFEGSIGWALGVMNNEETEDGMIEGIQDQGNTKKEAAQEGKATFREKMKDKLSVLYWGGYATLYGEDRARWLIGSTRPLFCGLPAIY